MSEAISVMQALTAWLLSTWSNFTSTFRCHAPEKPSRIRNQPRPFPWGETAEMAAFWRVISRPSKRMLFGGLLCDGRCKRGRLNRNCRNWRRFHLHGCVDFLTKSILFPSTVDLDAQILRDLLQVRA